MMRIFNLFVKRIQSFCVGFAPQKFLIRCSTNLHVADDHSAELP